MSELNDLLTTRELQRWRLILGEAAETTLCGLDDNARQIDHALEWLYGRDPERLQRGERSGGLGGSNLTTPEWINSIHTLFPQQVIERLESDAVLRYGIEDVVTNLDVLERMQPSESLLRAVLHTKHLMNPELPGIRTHLVAFDTSVVDLTADVADPVELLMKVQLGGGTNIASAVEYGRQLIEQPAKSVIILVSDFYEGGSSSLLTHQVKKCVQSGIKVLGLAALDSTATPCYDRDTAQALVNVGAQIAAMTPGELASWLAENLQS
ncbi:TPA: VWA domain-containing protein [Escherichia coli]|nr:VWA domain-containing protein [Escherichia coli O80:H45]EGM7110417.1 VWA domain-containing protein [Escherichia coli]MBI0597659.1 VWA domain-containing protein [Escherichia coli]WFX12058.1 VWA domain-containing protein [Escherichia coli]HBA2892574.1 VWA domain-containing protein [Escherichia coli]